MIIYTHPTFDKNFRKRILPNQRLTNKYYKRIELFMSNLKHPLLRDHGLIGLKSGLRAFSISGDYRVIYRLEITGEYTLLDIGTHNQIY